MDAHLLLFRCMHTLLCCLDLVCPHSQASLTVAMFLCPVFDCLYRVQNASSNLKPDSGKVWEWGYNDSILLVSLSFHQLRRLALLFLHSSATRKLIKDVGHLLLTCHQPHLYRRHITITTLEVLLTSITYVSRKTNHLVDLRVHLRIQTCTAKNHQNILLIYLCT